MSGLRGVRAGLESARRRFGRRRITWAQEFMGFGNLLYLWVWAASEAADEPRRLVLQTAKGRPWADLVPDFRDRHLVERSAVRLLDQRGHYWAEKARWAGDRRGFTDDQRAHLVRTWLAPAPLLAGVGAGPLADLASTDCLVVNVRRGDYYSVPEFRWEFGIDVVSYLREAVRASIERDGPVRRIHLVSDDPAWCERRLGWLARYADTVTSAGTDRTPADDLRALASARRLVITNSTFSMWAAGIGNVLHADRGVDNRAQVWVPGFFQQRYGPGRCFEYDAAWSCVEELPGGWSAWQPDWVAEGRDG